MDPNPADLLLTGGRVHTVDDARTVVEAVAVTGGRIAAVGSARELAPLAGASTRVVELEGRTVLPGFQDAHLHPLDGGLLSVVCDLHETSSAEECLDEIAAADLVVLDRDLFDRGAGPIGDARVLLTLVEGEPVYDDL
jgi:predicted amidohydrolase YtcJ